MSSSFRSTLTEEVIALFKENMPFNRELGLEVIQDGDTVRVEVPWQDKLTGNPFQKILHGGVTASLLDTVGGLVSIVQAIRLTEDSALGELKANLATAGTVDMRVDYLRPGRGKRFIATATVIRKGRRVAVCRMELHNESGEHIAFGTGTYMIG